MSNTFRVRESIAEQVVQMFPGSRIVKPPRSLDGGCGDPGHCAQHPGYTLTGELMVGIARTGVSGQEFHRRLVAAGLVR